MSDNLTSKRVLSSYRRFEKALLTLQEAVQDINKKNKYLQDATIQRFEYTYEAAWKAIKALLFEKGVSLDYPADIFREAYSSGWLLDAESGRKMVLSRNSTSHIYSEEKAEEIYDHICHIYYQELKYLQIKLRGAIDGNT